MPSFEKLPKNYKILGYYDNLKINMILLNKLLPSDLVIYLSDFLIDEPKYSIGHILQNGRFMTQEFIREGPPYLYVIKRRSRINSRIGTLKAPLFSESTKESTSGDT